VLLDYAITDGISDEIIKKAYLSIKNDSLVRVEFSISYGFYRTSSLVQSKTAKEGELTLFFVCSKP
jgi:hypothetical protein